MAAPESIRIASTATMQVLVLAVVLLLAKASSERLMKVSIHQEKPTPKFSKYPQSELSQKIRNEDNFLPNSSIDSKSISSNGNIFERERAFPERNSIELENNHDTDFEDNPFLHNSVVDRNGRRLDDKIFGWKRSLLSNDDIEPVREQTLKEGNIIRALLSASKNISDAQDEVTEPPYVVGLDEEGSGDRSESPSTEPFHADDEKAGEPGTPLVDIRRTSASPNNSNDNQSTVSPKKSEIGMCRLGLQFRKEVPTYNATYERITCFFCYAFIPKHRKKFGLGLNFSRYTFSYENTTNESFDTSAASWAVVRHSLIDDLEANKLTDCCAEAVGCCHTIRQAGHQGTHEEDHCPATWDGWSCFRDPVPAGTTVPVQCPVHAYTGYPECYLYGEKTCTSTGSWYAKNGGEYTDYSLCSMESYHLFLCYWELAVHCASILVLLPALLVLLCYKSLRKPWFHMLLNFYLALLLRSILMIIELSVIKIPEYKNISTIMEENGAVCKIIASFRKMFVLSVWVWMLANSVYLYRTVARALHKAANIRVYYISAWAATVVLTAVWVACRALLEDFQCWLGDQKGDPHKLYLIMDIPCMLSLLVSLVLLSHLACLVFDTMKGRSDSEREDNMKAFKATVFLVPMFGLQFLLTAIVVTEVGCAFLKVNLMVVTAVSGLQGVYASVVYCFMNAEVKRELLKTWYVAPTILRRRNSDDYGKVGYGQSSVGPATTYSTVNSEAQEGVGSNDVEMVPLKSDGSSVR